VGAGVILQPNVLKALRIGGIDQEVLPRGEAMQLLQVRDDRGRVLSSTDRSVFMAHFFAGVVGFHRATLHAALLDLIEPSSVRLGSAVRAFSQTESSVWVELETGERIEGAGLVGADGLRSAIRVQRLKDGEPRYSGYTSWRGVTARGPRWPPGQMCESWGRGARFGLVAIDGDRLYWFATANAPAGGREGSKNHLLQRFAGWHDPIGAVIESTPEDGILRTDLSDRDPVPRWSERRVTLLGDAAHPMTPNLGQGGGQAIEDAVVLDLVLSAEPDCARAFKDYESRRLARTARVVRESRRFGRIGQIENGVARAARDFAMRMTPPSLALRTLRWLYDFDV
jgi:2-polyprenyl-6-methoxyphenol hydroxylase-like FAD-dependent oxidoreductase